MSEVVELRSEARCSVVTIDDGKVNALARDVIRAVDEAVDHAEARGLPLVIAGRDGVFSAGFDLVTLQRFDRNAADMVVSGFRLAARVLACDVPVVLACTGHAIAMGAFLLVAGDARVGAAGDFRIGANEVALGIRLPDVAIELCRQRLAPAVLTRALANAEMFTPDAAVAAGFLDVVVAPADVVGAAEEIAVGLASFDVGLHTATKRRVRDDALAGIRAALARDAAGWGVDA